MHEVAMARAVVRAALAAAPPAAGSVTQVHVGLGALAGVSGPSLQLGYRLAVEGTVLAGSTLVLTDLPVVVHCPRCEDDVAAATPYDFRCPTCGTACSDVVSGRDVELLQLVLPDGRVVAGDSGARA